jgi:hypothetical protein
LKGFPPADDVLRDWLVSFKNSNNQDMVAKLHGFLSSLFSVTRKRLEVLDRNMRVDVRTWDDFCKLSKDKQDELVNRCEERREMLAAAFHTCMTKEQLFQAPNIYRHDFFQQVVHEASEVSI